MENCNPETTLQFIFTQESFFVDQPAKNVPDEEQELKERFLSDKYHSLFLLGFEDAVKRESPSLAFLRQVSNAFLRTVTDLPELEIAREEIRVALSDEVAEELLLNVPFCIGAEHITQNWLSLMFLHLNSILCGELSAYNGPVSLFFEEHTQKLRVPERIFFHLVETRKDVWPFAFLATYATRDEDGKVRHMPLSYALTEYKNEREKILSLLSCLNKVADVSPLLSGFISSGELFHPLRMTAEEAYAFLKAVPDIENCGVLCRIPNWWKKQYASVSLNVRLGAEKPSMLGFDALISMRPELMVGGEVLTQSEIEQLLKATEGLALLKGKWVEVDHAKLEGLLADMEKYGGDLTLIDALKLQAGMAGDQDIDVGTTISNGKWLGELLAQLRRPDAIKTKKVPASVHAKLRTYQETGYNWLIYMQKLGFGACLADDMGLGKTLQVLAFLEQYRKKNKKAQVLLIVPASLLGNWSKEADRFTPAMPYRILHGMGAPKLDALINDSECFLNITTYGMAARMKSLEDHTWDCVILDEAQAIKNPGTKQTRSIKKIPALYRIAMTGTPIENDLTNLWSLFDFLNKGLLGTSGEFHEFAKQLDTNRDGYVKLKNMVSPFILRRLKTDKAIAPDLPDKMEQIDYAGLSKKQIVLYRKQVNDLEKRIAESDGIERRGLVLAAIMKLKQICNHPDQFMGQETYDPKDSGKFQMLADICETIFEKRERVLVFTQFKEITGYLADFLEKIFGCRGLVLHGGIPAKSRSRMVEQFNGEEYVPYMVISVKAGGTGLNLTAANHVVHFDRWWNPAVENQATDRAFRIGQTKNVIVHKLVSEGTIEEKIDAIINSKKELAENVIGSGGEKWITELSDKELMNLMRLEL